MSGVQTLEYIFALAVDSDFEVRAIFLGFQTNKTLLQAALNVETRLLGRLVVFHCTALDLRHLIGCAHWRSDSKFVGLRQRFVVNGLSTGAYFRWPAVDPLRPSCLAGERLVVWCCLWWRSCCRFSSTRLSSTDLLLLGAATRMAGVLLYDLSLQYLAPVPKGHADWFTFCTRDTFL